MKLRPDRAQVRVLKYRAVSFLVCGLEHSNHLSQCAALLYFILGLQVSPTLPLNQKQAT